MPQVNQNVLPGKEGTDYHFVRFGDKVYVVYRVKLPNGSFVNTSWTVNKDDYKALGVDLGSVRSIDRNSFKKLNNFGSSSQIASTAEGEHPFNQFLKDLRADNGAVSWLADKEFMSVMLMGFAEQTSAEELRKQLTQTTWYKSRTDAQRAWELDTAPAQREADKGVWETRMTTALKDLYGPNYSLTESGFSKESMAKNVGMVASGKWGDPADGFEVWLQTEREKAQKIEGTTAWTEREQALEANRAFLNRPQDKAEELRQNATEWLGPRGVPDKGTLDNWAQRLVSEKSSDADWEQYIRSQAKSLYPYLGPEERWQDRASAYKRIAEEELGTTLDWNNNLLYDIGEKDAAGQFTGAAKSYGDFTKQVRSQDAWWGGAKAADEGFQLANYLNETMNGVK